MIGMAIVEWNFSVRFCWEVATVATRSTWCLIDTSVVTFDLFCEAWFFLHFYLYFLVFFFFCLIFCEQGNCTWRWIDTCGHIWSVLRGVKPKPSAFLFKNPPIDPFLHRVRLSLMSPNRRGWSIFNPRATFIQSFRRQCHILQTTKSSTPPPPLPFHLELFPAPWALYPSAPTLQNLNPFQHGFLIMTLSFQTLKTPQLTSNTQIPPPVQITLVVFFPTNVKMKCYKCCMK